MNQFKIILNEHELNNLMIFLERVDLKGKESIEFVKILQSLNAKELVE